MNLIPLLFAQRDDSAGALGALCGLLCQCGVFVVFVVPTIAGMWKIFEKAGKPGWASLIPFYNMFVLNEVARKEIIWFVLTLIPCINIVAFIVICMDAAKHFGKDPAYGIGMALLPFIFFPMLGFSDARYQPMAPPTSPPAY